MTFLIVLFLLCGQAFCATRYSLTTRPDPIVVTPSVSGCSGNRVIAEVVCSLVQAFPQLSQIKSAGYVCPTIGSDITTTYYGITYHGDDPCNGIKSIDLSALNLQGTIPTELGKADTMTSLNFGNNKLQGTIPTELSNLKKLEVLSLFFTGVSGTIPSQLKELSFSILDLSANQLQGTIPSPLRIDATLDLSGNSLTGPLPKVSGTITEVFLNNNKLTTVDSEGFGNVSSLKFYDISFNAFTGPIPDALLLPAWLPELQSAYLQSNYFESLPTGKFSVNLTQLDCSYNYLSGALELNWECSPAKVGGGGQECLDRFAFFQGNRLNITAAFKMSGVSILRLYLKPQDVDDCSGGTHECESECINGWAPALSYTCSCPNGKYLLKDGQSCDTCFGDWELSNFYLDNYKLFPSLEKAGYSLDKFDQNGFLSCSSCNSGLRYRNRTVAFSDDCVRQGPMFQSQPCEFACSNLKETSATGVLLSLSTELDKGDFLKSMMKELFNVDISIVPKEKRDASTLAFDMSPCQANQANDIQTFLQSLFSDIVPNAPPISFTVPTSNSPNCTIAVSSQDASSPLVAIIVGTAVAALVLALIIGIIAYKLATRSLLHHLPHVVAESYLYYERNPFAWEFKGSKVNGYYFREVPKATDEYSKVKDELLTGLLSLDARLEVEKLVAVYNPTLVSNFIGTYLIQSDRVQRNSHIFFNQKWKTEDNSELRQWVWSCYENIVRKCSWNSSAENISVAIIPAVHGTTLPIASAICETGFASVSSLDSGWYGKGIYFTSYCPYTITYIYGKNQPALVLSWILPGNVYPVTEHHKGPQSLLGTALKNGYNSHFVQSTASGVVPPKPISGLYNEIVVSQESQIAPAYIIHLSKVSKSSFSRFMAERGKELTEDELQQAADDLDRKRFKSSSKGPKFLKPKLSVNSYVSLDEQSALEEKKRKKFGSLSQSGTVSIDLDADSQSYHN